ncbi:MAG: toprim domain-containing protein, partial [Parasphingorhabdus sp.]
GTGAVRLFPPKDGVLGLAEGTESAMSATQLTGIPTWATLGNERFGIVTIPESVKQLHLFVDHDAGGDLAEAKAREHFQMPGRSIIARRPSRRDDDWNDELFRANAAST